MAKSPKTCPSKGKKKRFKRQKGSSRKEVMACSPAFFHFLSEGREPFSFIFSGERFEF
jgi:hypothetical protein